MNQNKSFTQIHGYNNSGFYPYKQHYNYKSRQNFGYNAKVRNNVKATAVWEWKPVDPNGESIKLKKFDYIDPKGMSKSVMAGTAKND